MYLCLSLGICNCICTYFFVSVRLFSGGKWQTQMSAGTHHVHVHQDGERRRFFHKHKRLNNWKVGPLPGGVGYVYASSLTLNGT